MQENEGARDYCVKAVVNKMKTQFEGLPNSKDGKLMHKLQALILR